MATSECVKVIVRCRPINERERNLNCGVVIKMDPGRGQCSIQPPSDPKAPPKVFTFDGAYSLDSTTEQIYEDIAYPLVEGVTEGYNGTIFAYGQTGCGKSFTMQGIKDPASQRGIIPRAFEHIFETVSVSESTKFLIQASYLEIYQEEIRDLLGNNIKAKLDLKEHPEKGVYVNSLSKFTVHSVKECEALMERGWKNRSTGATLMNTDSSRSHSIFTISVEMCRQGDDGEDHIRAGKLNLVDLAGSERQAKTGATGTRLREATKINMSLSALGNVISALIDGKSTHIPYRDSKLTRLLQDSLGGNTKTLMIACLSPADNNYEESLSTLRYANRAKNIKNKPKINEDPKDALLREYQEEISKLKAMLAGQLPASMEKAPGPQIVEKVVHVDYSEEIEEEKLKIREEYERQIADLNTMFETERVTKTKLQDDMDKLRDFYDHKLSSVDGKYANLPPPAAILGEAGYENYDGSAGQSPDPAMTSSSLANERPMTGHSGKILGETSIETDRRTSNGDIPDGDSAVCESNYDDYEAGAKAALAAAQKNGVPALLPTSTAVPESASPQGAKSPVPMVGAEQAAMAKDALRRLQELELQMVGGENVHNKEVEERRTKKRNHAEEKRRKLADANSNLEDDGIMEGIFDSIHDEVRAKNKLLEKAKMKSSMLERELIDIQSEFEFDRIDYLDTIRKQDREIQLLKTLLDKVQPCIRRDCNYSNLDRIRSEAKWDEEQDHWLLPNLKVEKTSLPGGLPGGAAVPVSGGNGNYRPDSDTEDDKYRQRLQRSNKEEAAKSYFSSKRAEKLLNGNGGQIDGRSNGQQDVRNGHYESNGNGYQGVQSNGYQNVQSNGYHMAGTSHLAQNGSAIRGGQPYQDSSILGDVRAAQVHGQNIDPDLPIRKPVRLSSLPPASAKRTKRKSRGALEPL